MPCLGVRLPALQGAEHPLEVELAAGVLALLSDELGDDAGHDDGRLARA